jgi:predicted MFS family arabinose efflux permease
VVAVSAALDRDLRTVRLAAFASTFDRFAIPPMLATIASELGVSLADVALAASIYFLLYGVTQPFWGLLSDRIGRVRLMQLALAAAAVAGAASAAASSVGVLIGTRAVCGALLGAVIPASLVYIGDSVPPERRQQALASQMSATAVATATATLVCGMLAAFVSWRVGFALPAAGCAVLALALTGVAEPSGRPVAATPIAQVRHVARRPWAVLVIAFALIEGLVAFGGLPFLAPALESTGRSAAVAGLAVALFGAAQAVWSQVVKRALVRRQPATLMAVGGTAFAAGYAAAAASQGVGAIAGAAVLVGGGYAFFHTGLQAWATEAAPEARATTIAFFASGLFVGSAVATALFGPLADDKRYGLVFGLCAAGSLPLGFAAAAARRAWGRRS